MKERLITDQYDGYEFAYPEILELLGSSFVSEHHLPNGMLDNAKQSCLNYIMQNRLGDSAEFH